MPRGTAFFHTTGEKSGIGEDDFDKVFARIRDRGLQHWADPGKQRAGEIYRHNGERGVYFEDPDDHLLDVMTRPYEIGG